MERSRTVLWYEDLECHRQPSLYYLTSEDDPAGPHLICDWNGAPTDLGELEFDLMGKLIETRTQDIEHETRILQIDDPNDECDSQIHDIIVPRSIASHTNLTENDGSQLNFLTVPPYVENVIKRLTRSQNPKHPTIPEEVERDKPPDNEPKSQTTSTSTKAKVIPTISNIECGASPPKKAKTKLPKNNIKKETSTKSKNTCKTMSQEQKSKPKQQQQQHADRKIHIKNENQSQSQNNNNNHRQLSNHQKTHKERETIVIIDDDDFD